MTFSKKKAFPNRFRGALQSPGRFLLIRPFVYNSEMLGEIEVPVGFVSDGASIPRMAWPFVGSPWSGRYAEAAVIHDYLYDEQDYERVDCDKTFLEAMEVLKVPRWKRRTIYRSVRMFGWIPWNKHAKRRKK